VNPAVVPVSLLTTYLKQLIENDDILSDVWVEGEVSHSFHAGSGHVYFTLQGDGATLKCVLFRVNAMRQRHLPSVGNSVVVHGRVGLYDRDNTVQLYVDVIQPSGIGIQALELERLRQQLEHEGLFDPSRKRPLPPRPKAIGVVTSPDGAVWHDIQQVLRRRYPMVEVVLAPAAVQGDEAPTRLVTALSAIQDHPGIEVIIIGRGGGSVEDLAAFNTEAVARAIFASALPVVSAVGHETDWTIADFVADVRASTPSVAAELCVPSVLDLRDDLASYRQHLDMMMQSRIRDTQSQIERQRSRLIRLDARKWPEVCKGSILQYAKKLDTAYDAVAAGKRHESRYLRGVLEALNPRRIMERGYAAVADVEDNSPITRGHQAQSRRVLRLHFHDAAVTVRTVDNHSDHSAESGDAAI
jgi:exodeoxyribonuclease VII large subunit